MAPSAATASRGRCWPWRCVHGCVFPVGYCGVLERLGRPRPKPSESSLDVRALSNRDDEGMGTRFPSGIMASRSASNVRGDGGEVAELPPSGDGRAERVMAG